MTDEQLCALLRLKRHEQPPEGYFDQLLRDVHHRQRAELLRQPLWKIALERWQTFFGEHSMGGYSYAGSLAAVLVVGAASVFMLTSGPGPSGNGAAPLARNEPAAAPAAVAAKAEPRVLASLSGRVAQIPPVQFPPVAPIPRDAPRYVIDARPVSYDRSFSF